MNCRICQSKTRQVLDLGKSPPANSLLSKKEQKIKKYPLVLDFCENCNNLQLRDCLNIDDLYKHYYYITPQSTILNDHYEYLTKFLISRNYINNSSKVIEIGSNVGLYLDFLKPYVGSVLGVDPAKNITQIANRNGIPTICDFFNNKLANEILSSKGKADAIIARHCFAHNSSPHELLKGVKALLSQDGAVIIENAYVLNTLENNEFDQIYHEHMFYYSIQSMSKALEMNDLRLQDVYFSLVHGGSILFVAKHSEAFTKESDSLKKYLQYEKTVLNNFMLDKFSSNVFKFKKDLKNLIISLKKNNPLTNIYTYGATAKGNTLLNYVELNQNHINYCVDCTEIKQGKYLPGSNIKIISEEYADKHPPTHFLLTAWNYKDEIIKKVRNKGNLDSAFIIPFPNLTIS